MNLIPVHPDPADNEHLIKRPDCPENLNGIVDYYKVIGYNPPWICYYAEVEGNLVGGCAFKGAPKENKVELAYETFEPFQNKGYASKMCIKLIELARDTDMQVKITARTLPETSYSTRILEKIGFQNNGIVIDYDDGEVWEWVLPDTRYRY